jgi:hypothetical protein
MLCNLKNTRQLLIVVITILEKLPVATHNEEKSLNSEKRTAQPLGKYFIIKTFSKWLWFIADEN